MYSKKIMKISLAMLASIVFIFTSHAQIANGYEVATWQGYRKCASSYTFDDGYANQLNKAMPVFDKYGYHMTLFIVTSWVGGNGRVNWNGLKGAAGKGHEIAGHTRTHADGGSGYEISGAKSEIEAQVGQYACITHAYPSVVMVNDKGALWDGYLAARMGGGSGVVSNNPSDMFNLDSKICGPQGNCTTGSNLTSVCQSAMSSNGWAVFMFHGVDGEGSWSDFSSSELDNHLSWVKQNDGDVWAASFGEVAKYIWERKAVIISENAISDNSYEVSITLNYNDGGVNNNLDKAVYDEPLTIKRTYPSGWEGVNVFIDNTQIDAYDDGSSVVFDAAPYRDVRIENTAQVVVDTEDPTISCPEDKSAEIEEGQSSATIDIGTANADDNVGVASLDNDAPSTFPLGSTTVTWTATDAAGNSATCTQKITVTQKIDDNEDPTITCPDDVSATVSGGVQSTTVNLGDPETDDNIGVASVDNNAPNEFPIGKTIVTWTVADLGGNTATCEQTVTVIDGDKILLPLKKGWNLIGYPKKGKADIAEVLEEIWEKVDQIKDQENFYDKNQDLGQLTQFEFSKGYFIKVSENCEFSW